MSLGGWLERGDGGDAFGNAIAGFPEAPKTKTAPQKFVPGQPSALGQSAGKAPKSVMTAADEIASLGKLGGKSAAEIQSQLSGQGYTSFTGNNGGTIYTKSLPDGNTAVVRVDPPMVRASPRGFADEVPHIDKEIVPTDRVASGNYRPSDATKLNDDGIPTTDPHQSHIPGGH